MSNRPGHPRAPVSIPHTHTHTHTHTQTHVTCFIRSHFPVPATRRSPLRSVRPRFILVSISFTFLASPILLHPSGHTHMRHYSSSVSFSLSSSAGSALSPFVSLLSVHFPASRVCLAGITTDNLVTGKYLGDKRPRRGGTERAARDRLNSIWISTRFLQFFAVHTRGENVLFS